MRAPFQVLVLPFRIGNNQEMEFAVFRRQDNSIWQGIAGGGEDDESPLQAAVREAQEEAGIPNTQDFFALDTRASIPKYHFKGHETWPLNIFVIHEYIFAVDCNKLNLAISKEHSEVQWLSFEQAFMLVKWDSNKTALWELYTRICESKLSPALA